MVLRLLYAVLATGIEFNLDAQGAASLTRHHHRQVERTAEHAETERAHLTEHEHSTVEALGELSSRTRAAKPDWLWKYDRLRQKTDDFSFLQEESRHVAKQYRDLVDSGRHADKERTRTMSLKYYDMKDELKALKKDVKHRANEILDAVHEVGHSAASADVRHRLTSLFTQLGGDKKGSQGEGKHHVHRSPSSLAQFGAAPAAATNEASAAGAADPDDVTDDRSSAGSVDDDEEKNPDAISVTEADSEKDDIVAKYKEKWGDLTEHHQQLKDSLEGARSPLCSAAQTTVCVGCVGIADSEKNLVMKCRSNADDSCKPWEEEGKCPDGYVPCDEPVPTDEDPDVAFDESGLEVMITIQGYNFHVGTSPSEDTCMLGTLLPRKRLVENMNVEENKLESACTPLALQKNMELELLRCFMGYEDDDEDGSTNPVKESQCYMAHLNTPVLGEAKERGADTSKYKGSTSARYRLPVGQVAQPYGVDIHYVMCLVRGPTEEGGETAFTFVAADICVKKTLEIAEDGTDKESLVKCDGISPTEGGGVGASTMALLLLWLIA